MLLKQSIIFFNLLFIVMNASADYPKTSNDFALLPPFCKAKLSPNATPQEINLWSNKLGPNFMHTHHYCAALHSLRVAQTIYSKTEKAEKAGWISSALNEIAYMEQHASPTYILFPHIYTTKAEAYLEIDQHINAFTYFNKAITANRKFTKPYALMSDYYVKNNNKKEARIILEEGLKYSPKSKQLNRRLDKLSKR